MAAPVQTTGKLHSPLTIAFVNSSRGWGGGEVWLRQIVNGLASRGHSVLVICRPDSALAGRAVSIHAEMLPVNFNWDFNPATVRMLYRLLIENHVDVVCTNWEKELRLCGLAGRLANIPVVPSREVDRPIKSTLVNRWVYGSLAQAIMVNSFATRATLFASAPWLAAKPCRIVWKGIDPEIYKKAAPAPLRSELGIGNNSVLVGFVGRLDEQKGIPDLLEAMRLAASASPEISFVLAGDGPLRPRVATYVERYGLSETVHLLGFREDIPSLLKAFDFLVMPSLWEGFGYAALEAMAAGKAVIATNTSSLPELVEDGVTGLLVPPHSPEELSVAIGSLAADRNRQSEFGAAGHERAVRMFTLARMVDETEEFLADVVEGNVARYEQPVAIGARK